MTIGRDATAEGAIQYPSGLPVMQDAVQPNRFGNTILPVSGRLCLSRFTSRPGNGGEQVGVNLILMGGRESVPFRNPVLIRRQSGILTGKALLGAWDGEPMLARPVRTFRITRDGGKQYGNIEEAKSS